MDEQKHLNELFRKAKEQNPAVTFNETMERFLTSGETNSVKSKGKKGSFLLTKKLIIMIVTVSTLIIALFFSNSQSENRSIPKLSSNVSLETKKKSESIANNQVHSTDPAFKLVESLPNFTQIFQEVNQFSIAKSDTLKVQEKLDLIKSNIPIFNDEYVFPKLTEDEIKANNKQKKAMMKALEKFDRKIYAFLLSGSFDYLGEMRSVQAFLIQKTEVSNLEYRTFLFDLLLQGRKDDFLKAKPDQNKWVLLSWGENNTMKDHYFSHEAYNNFPVVNVSREGAELYCKWFSQELDKVVEEKKRNLYNDIRIPMREEWVMAASIEGKKGPYPWDGISTKNSDGMIMANYAHKPEENVALDFTSSDVIAPCKSYWPNDFGLYNMSGNVSEMVYNDIKTKSAGTAGGGWMNSAEEIKILGPDPYTGITDTHPCIGFRVVMTVKK